MSGPLGVNAGACPYPKRSLKRGGLYDNGAWQVSIFLVGDHTVLFIQRTPSDVSDHISNRMVYAGSKLRLNNARYLVRDFATCSVGSWVNRVHLQQIIFFQQENEVSPVLH